MTGSFELAGCPVCGSDTSEEVAGNESIAHELEQLWSFQMRRLRTGVPVRHLLDRVVFSHHPPLHLARCADCGTVYRNPREDGSTVLRLYQDEEPEQSVLEILFGAQRDAYRAQARRLARLAGERGAGLEVGSYVGAFLAAAREIGWSFEGVDVNAAASGFARGQGLDARPGTLEEVDTRRRFDAIAIWNCFDQLPEPRTVVRTARGLLRDGGFLALRVPNGAFYARWRPRLHGPVAPLARALLAHNNLLGFPYRHGFTPSSLQHLLRENGFRTVKVYGDALVPVADGWTHRWAAWEERLVKSALRAAPLRPASMPWFEVYARAV